MINRKKHLMANFYEMCQEKGYTNMCDSTQSLKAKVIATDLGLNYVDIVKFYDAAKICYEQVCQEQIEEKIKLAEQNKMLEEEERRRAVNGELLLTLSNHKNTISLSVYIRPDNSIYSQFNDDHRVEGCPTIQAKKTCYSNSKYIPSEAVYTAVTVGGVTTGGVHYTKDGYSTSMVKQGKGKIIVAASGKEFDVNTITMSNFINDRFKRDAKYQSLVHDGRIYCGYGYSNDDMVRAVAGPNASTLKMDAISKVLDDSRLPYKECVEISELIKRVVNGQFPPTDEDIYQTSKVYANSNNSNDLKRAIDGFESLGDYEDAKQRADDLKPRYEEILQYEKEQAILEKEAKQEKIEQSIKKTITKAEQKVNKMKKIVFVGSIFVNVLVTSLLAFAAWKSYDMDETNILPIFIIISAIVSIPGIGKIIFRKKYGLFKRVLRWIFVAVIFFLGFVVAAIFK